MAADALFCIVIPTRDRPFLLDRVLAALKSQSYAGFRVVISDNAVNSSCMDVVRPYLKDDRFSYKKPPSPMNMCDHWNFAIEGVVAEYVTVFNEKFVLCPDALEIMAAEIGKSNPDILTWQYDFFEVVRSEKNLFFGTYHPRIKPSESFFYDPKEELMQRFAFDFPVFSRYRLSKNNYGKIYTGFFKKGLVDKITEKYGCLFRLTNPDFTSMAAALNESGHCVDMNRSLMLLNNFKDESNGEQTRTSSAAMRRYISSLGLDVAEHAKRLPIPGFCIGHNNYIAADLEMIRDMAPKGFISTQKIDRSALAYWAMQDLRQVTDLGAAEVTGYENILKSFLDGMSQKRREELDLNASLCNRASRSEIYHSGLQPIDDFVLGTTPEELAKIHWMDGLAPPRKSVTKEPMEFSVAMDYCHRYNVRSRQLLGIE